MQRQQAGYEVHVVFMTDGRESHRKSFGMVSDPAPEELRVIRRREARRATGILGVKPENLIFLYFKDRMLESNIEAAAEDVKGMLKQIQPMEVYFPSEYDDHTDHFATNIIVRRAIEFLAGKPLIYLYTVWPRRDSSVSSMTCLKVDVSGVLLTKKKALAEYKSQVTEFSKLQRRPVLTKTFLKRFLRGYEVFITH